MDKAQVIHIDFDKWLQAFRGITTSTNERTMIAGNLPASAVGNNAPVVEYEYAPSVASLLVLANMNSIPLDWATRLSIGGVNMNFFIVKQLPVLPPETYLEDALPGVKYAELVVPRALELTYTSWELQPFAADLGYEGEPFAWDDDRRHKLQCEMDAVFAHMYGLERAELEWVLDAQPPSESFPGLKRNEIQRFGEYRTQRYVLAAYDMMARGDHPNID